MLSNDRLSAADGESWTMQPVVLTLFMRNTYIHYISDAYTSACHGATMKKQDKNGRKPPSQPATQHLRALTSRPCGDPGATGLYQVYTPARRATAEYGGQQKKLELTVQEQETRARNGSQFGRILDSPLSESEKSLL